MNIEAKDLEKSQIEITVELSTDEFAPYVKKGAEELSKEIKIEGFRPGKVPIDVLKRKVGELSILDAGARIAVNKTAGEALESQAGRNPIGHPEISIMKLAPGNPFVYKILIPVLPEIILGPYKDLKFKQSKTEIAPEELEKAVMELREMRAREIPIKREAGMGDKLIIDIEMFLDSVPIEGAQGKGVAVMLGKDFVIPGFDKAIIGMKKGGQREFTLPYPADHFNTALAGKVVEFRVSVSEILERILPDDDDNFAKAFGFNSKAHFREEFGKNMLEEKKREKEDKIELEMLDKISGSAKFSEIPEFLIHAEADKMMGELKAEIERRQGKFEEYLSSLKKSELELKLDLMPNAVKRVKTALVIRKIAEAEKVEVTDADIDHELKHLLERYKGYEKVEEHLKSPDYRPVLKNILLNRIVIAKLKEWNIEKN
jgi:trigger factor